MQGQQRQDIQAMFEREAGELPNQFVRAPDGRWTASVPGLSPPEIATAEGDSVVFVDIPIGTIAPVYCQVYHERADPAETIDQLLDLAAQRVQFQNIVPWAVTVDNDYPTAWVEAAYLVDQAGGKAVGHLKLAVSAREDHPLVCSHDELGYKDSFRRVAQGFFQSFKPSQKPAKPIYLEVLIRYAEEVPIGFSRSVLTEDDDGRQRWTTKAILMIPVGQAELQLKDEYEILLLDAKRYVDSGHWKHTSEGESPLDIHLERVKGNLYRYEGQFQGKPVKGDFRTRSTQGLSSVFSIASVLEERLAQTKSFQFLQEEYAPRLDPASPQRVIYRRAAEDPPRVVRSKAGTIETLWVVDEHGLLSEGQIQLGRYRFSFRREVHKGEP